MAHFAKISEENIVLGVHVVDNVNAPTEADGQAYLETVHGWPAHLWKQTSYNTVHGVHYTEDENRVRSESADQSKAFRKNFAGVGIKYDAATDAFIDAASPYPSWVMNETKGIYEAPEALPADAGRQEDGSQNFYEWDESIINWKKTIIPAP
jgi:hypothetical protein|tara:strand:+ start:490 stop:945 length:456 start_codon:yes stop_codon:yes gene_type:complete